MESIIKEYLEWKGGYAPRASVNYKIWLERFVTICGDKPLAEYEIADITRYRKWVEVRYGSYTVQFATIVIKNFFSYFKLQNKQCLQPRLIKLPRIQAKSHRAISEEEFTKIIATLPTTDFRSLRDLILIRLLWDTGVRVSELCDLDISQIQENKRSAVIQTKKNGKKRIIVWSTRTHGLIMEYLPQRLEADKFNNTSALFVGWNNNGGWSSRLTSRSVQRTIKHLVQQAGINQKITPHSFRHGWAHKRRDANAPLAFIQRGLGHQNPVSTFIYEQYNDVEFERNANSYLQAA